MMSKPAGTAEECIASPEIMDSKAGLVRVESAEKPRVSRPALPEIIQTALNACPDGSDIFFSPGRPVQVASGGSLVAVDVPGLPRLNAEITASISEELLGDRVTAAARLAQEGACDLSYSMPSHARLRANIFIQRGSRAVVMRVIPTAIPEIETLGLPPQVNEISKLISGLVLVTGPTSSGKSTTLASLIDRINRERACHIITIEDPIEFLHRHQKATVHQRELHSDTPSFAFALRAALRQAPHVILVGEMRDRETTEIALEAAETGHLVLSTVHTIDASKTVERIVGLFPPDDQRPVRVRLARSFRYILSQRLIPQRDGTRRVPVVEILRSSARTREYIENGESQGKTLLDAMRDGNVYGMQHFDGEIERLIRTGVIDASTGLSYATNPGNLELQLSDLHQA
ncbi:MAG TPA: PilT/PilU family type 4a pilus ATPase [Terriglobia bacterium]|nr:PilT/PilU family type 4a pilus ATPase [Terriglobia bacterium]